MRKTQFLWKITNGLFFHSRSRPWSVIWLSTYWWCTCHMQLLDTSTLILKLHKGRQKPFSPYTSFWSLLPVIISHAYKNVRLHHKLEVHVLHHWVAVSCVSREHVSADTGYEVLEYNWYFSVSCISQVQQALFMHGYQSRARAATILHHVSLSAAVLVGVATIASRVR